MAPSDLVFGMAIQLASQLFNLAIKYLRLLRVVCMRRTWPFKRPFKWWVTWCCLQWLAGYLGLTWSSCGMVHGGKGLIFVFQEFSASINKAFILAGGDWALRYHLFYGVWTLSSYFLISQVFCRSATCEATHIYHVYK